MNTSRALRLLLLIVLLGTTVNADAQEEARAAWQVLRFDINATLPAATTIGERVLTARAVLNVRNVGQGTGRTFTVRLNPAAEVTAAQVGDAAAATPARTLVREEGQGGQDKRAPARTVTVTLPTPVAPGATISVAFDYRLPLTGQNTAFAAVSPRGAQFLPLSQWYPAPNRADSPRGADTAPVRLSVNAPGGDTIISSGATSPEASVFEQKLHAQPFFITGRWETLDGMGDARGISALLPRGASADERRQAQSLVSLAAAARAYFAGLLGALPAEVPMRLVAVRRGGGFDAGGTVLLDESAFRRAKVDAVSALLVAEAMARLWIGGATPISGPGAGVVRDGLTRHLATLFLERQFGREAADAERLRERLAYAAVARLDAPLSVSTPAEPTYYTSAANKGAMVWRLAERALGRDSFLALVRAQLQAKRGTELTLAAVRAALNEQGGAALKSLLDAELDQPTDLDLLVGAPQPRGAEFVSAVRNTGAFDVSVNVVATNERGERSGVAVTLRARDFGEAVFKTPSRIVGVEIDPEKFYPQLDYANDSAPRLPAVAEAVADATRLLTAQEYARAETIARQTLQQEPLLQDARVLLARALLEQNKLDEAEREFRILLDDKLPLSTALAWGSIGLGEIALRRNQPTDAAKRFDEAVRADALYGTTLAARAARLKAESTVSPAVDAEVRAFFERFDAAARSGRRADLDALIVAGELVNFAKGIATSLPEQWQTRVLRTETLGADSIAADVTVNAKTIGGREQSGTAVFVLARTPAGLRLSEIPIFEVR